MEATFNDKTQQSGSAADIVEQDAQRRLDNASKSVTGEPQVGGSAGRAQISETDPKAHDNTTGGPGSEGNKPIQDPVV
ncbi:hypothetical protein FA10DRAFT_285942 [Acaromyces ingoldii]|uniref:Uncharacterized protein n=1 Tax=Acaromyces ingoldii TaxID=215250 RepID=A0A316YLU8_9BASI|nr:hypothetical protein FA10DRAFT_285942 [Acaromyces ingoldii]PWN90229.1 hypothetical protein FA10DRAFT_285942 [Acaromyces ingoldii]